MQKRVLYKNTVHNRAQKFVGNRSNHRSYVKKKKEVFSHNKTSKKLLLIGFTSLLIFSSFNAYHAFSKENTILTKNVKITPIGEECQNILFDKTIRTLIHITKGETEHVERTELIAYNESSRVSFDLSETKLIIDKANTRGTLNDYFLRQEIFLKKDALLKNLDELISLNFGIRLNYIISADSTIKLEPMRNNSFISQVFSPAKARELEGQVLTNICQDTLDKDLNSIFNINTDYKRDQELKNQLFTYLKGTDIKKEQLRIHINNKTGVETVGEELTKLLENYGLKVTKVDFSKDYQQSTRIFCKNQDCSNTVSIQQIQDLLHTNDAIVSPKTIFGDVYIEVGQDFLE